MSRGLAAAPSATLAEVCADHEARPRRRWTVRAPIGLGFLALLAVVGFAIQHRADRRWEELLRATAALEARLDAESPTRPVLHGDATDGLAHPHYERAQAAVVALGLPSGDIAKIMHAQASELLGEPHSIKVPASPTAAELIASSQTAIDALAVGAHSRDGRPPILWAKGFGHPTDNLLAARDVVNLALVHAVAAAAGRDHARAARIWLDALQYCGDLLRSGLVMTETFGVAGVAIATGETPVTAALLANLDADALRTLREGLVALDSSLPRFGRCVEGEIALFVRHVDNLGWGCLEMPRWRAWRYGFSGRLTVAAYGFESMQLATHVRAHVEEAPRFDYTEVQRLCDAFRNGRN